MPSVEERLLQLMATGWNIDVECKSASREFALTFEAQGWKYCEGTFSRQTIHAFGNTLTDVLDEMEEQINDWSVVE